MIKSKFLYKINEKLGIICENRRLGSTEQDYMIMYAIARGFQVKKVLEIGTHQGGSSIIWCQSIIDNGYVPEVKTIDLWCGCGKITKNYKQDAINNIKDAGFSDYVEFIEGDSTIEVPKIFEAGYQPDLCFIDGNHEVEYVIKDFNNCKNYTNLIILHDTKLGKLPYLKTIRDQGWNILSIPTKYIEGDCHLVGISIAVKGEF